MKMDALDRFFKRLKGGSFKPGSPAQFTVIVFAAIVCWMFWAQSSSFLAIWASAEKLDGTAAAGTAAAGAWGDSFGGFNALVGALGFGAVAITLNLQYRSLERQNIDQHISRFEENFFRLIDLMRSLRTSLRYEQTSKYVEIRPNSASPGKLTGYEAIEAAYYEVNFWIFKNQAGREKIARKIVAGNYDNYVHSRFESCFAPYFRIIYTTLYNIKNDSVLSETQKAYYGNILRAQLTSFEVGLMAFNATSTYAKDLSDLITYFRLLKYLPKKRRRVLGEIFSEQAYEARS